MTNQSVYSSSKGAFTRSNIRDDFSVLSEMIYLVTSLIRRVKRDHFHRCFNRCRSDIRKTWKNIRNLMGTKESKCKIYSLVINDETIHENKDIANSFNEYFSGIALDLQRQMPPPVDDPLRNISSNAPNSFFIYPVTSSEVESIVGKLKNSYYETDSIPVKIFKIIFPFLSEYVAKLVNDSFSNALFPNCLGMATIVPIHKSGPKSSIANYRPISILPLLSKIFEKCMSTRLVRYLEKFNLICPQQFGFRKGKSTADAIVNLTELVYGALDDKNHALTISIDLRKAFDTVSHSLLLNKLNF